MVNRSLTSLEAKALTRRERSLTNANDLPLSDLSLPAAIPQANSVHAPPKPLSEVSANWTNQLNVPSVEGAGLVTCECPPKPQAIEQEGFFARFSPRRLITVFAESVIRGVFDLLSREVAAWLLRKAATGIAAGIIGAIAL